MNRWSMLRARFNRYGQTRRPIAAAQDFERGGLPAISLKAVSKSFSGVHALFSDLSLDLFPGQACALVGANGAGKSTLLRCIVGAEHLDDGVVELFGQPMVESDATMRLLLASLLDDVEFFPDLSVIEHLRFIAWLHQVDDATTIADAILCDVGLQSVADQLPPTLSSGQRQRLGLGACFVRPHRILVLDEPESRLDQDGHRWLQERLVTEKLTGTAILFSSHDSDFVSNIADQTIRL